MDYSMTGGVLKMKLRAATTGYILRKWSVDSRRITVCVAMNTGYG